MSVLYLINYRSAQKTITDRPSVYTWFKWSGTIATIMTCNDPIPKKIRSVSDCFLECSAPNVNRLFSGLAPFLEQNLVIILSDLRLGKQYGAYPIRYGLNSSTPNRSGMVWFPRVYCSHFIGSISKPAQKSFWVNMAWIVHYFVEWGTITRCDLSRQFFCIDATLLGTMLQCPESKKHLLVSADTWYGSSTPESNVD